VPHTRLRARVPNGCRSAIASVLATSAGMGYVMIFKTRPSAYRIDIAPTSRARCRGPCKQAINKGDLRITITAFVRPNRSTLLARCCHCIDARFASAVLAVYGAADRVPVAQGVSDEGAAQVRFTLNNTQHKKEPCRLEHAVPTAVSSCTKLHRTPLALRRVNM